MKFNKVRLPLAASVSASDPLTFGPPEAGYTDMTSYDGFGWVPPSSNAWLTGISKQ